MSDFNPSFEPPSGEFNNDIPVVEFWATGAGWQHKSGKSAKGNEWHRINFKFKEAEIVETTEPFMFPVFEVSMFYSDPSRTPKRQEGQGTSEWEILSESIREYFPESTGGVGILNDLMGGQFVNPGDEITGRRQHWKRVESLIRVGPNQSNPEWHDEEMKCWKLVGIEGMKGSGGAGGVDIYTYLADLADGKTSREFKTAALGDREVLSKPAIVGKFTEDTMVQELVDLEKVSRDAEDRLHKVG